MADDQNNTVEVTDLEKDAEIDIALQDSLLQLAVGQDNAGFADLQTNNPAPAIKESIDETILLLTRKLLHMCESILSPQPTTDPPNRLAEIMDRLFYPPTHPEDEPMREQVKPMVMQIRWLREKYVELEIPNAVTVLQRLSQRYFTATTTYDEVHNKQALALDLLLSLPNIELPNQQFSEDVEFALGVTQDKIETDEEFAVRVTDVLYYFQLLGDLIVTAQELKSEPDDAIIDLNLVYDLAPNIIRPLALARDQLLKTLLFPEEFVDKETIEEVQAGRRTGQASASVPLQQQANPTSASATSTTTTPPASPAVELDII